MAARNARDARSRTSKKPPTKSVKEEEIDPEEEDTDEDDEEEEELDDEETQDDDDEEEDDEPELDGFTLKSAVVEVKRLRKELHTIKKENVSLRRKKDPQKPLPDPDEKDKEIEIEEARTSAAKMQRIALNAQTREAVRGYMDKNKLSDYGPSVSYMVKDLELGAEDIDDDSGLYDESILDDAVEKSVRIFVKANPRKKASASDEEEEEEEKTVPRSRRGSGIGGSPARRATKNGAGRKRSKLDQNYPGLLDSPLYK